MPRFYRGVFFALLQGPLARFGATAANEAMLSVVAEAQLATSPLWMAAATAAASAAAGTWRWFIMPLDTCKTILQVTMTWAPCCLFKHLHRLEYMNIFSRMMQTGNSEIHLSYILSSGGWRVRVSPCHGDRWKRARWASVPGCFSLCSRHCTGPLPLVCHF